jgi:hypothetical protein
MWHVNAHVAAGLLLSWCVFFPYYAMNCPAMDCHYNNVKAQKMIVCGLLLNFVWLEQLALN